jgi:hypothetical protein
MRAAAATILLLGAGLLAGKALGDTVPVPPLPTVTVSTSVTVPITVPTLPLPPVTTTQVTTTSVKVPPPAPATQVTTSTTALVPPLPSASSVVAPTPAGSSSGASSSGGSSSSAGGSSTSGSSSSTGGSSTAGSSSSGVIGSSSSGPGSIGPNVGRFRTSRAWIATSGPKRRRVVTLTFSLPHAERVLFVIQQVAPSCRTVEQFTVRGHAGRNRIRFPAAPSRLRLVPGTYRISAHTSGGLLVRRVTIVVVDRGKPSRAEIAAARAANVCPAADKIASAKGSSGASSTGSPAGSLSGTPLHEGANTRSGSVLGASLTRAARALEPLVIGLLGLAIALLGIASLPRFATTGSPANEFLDRYRIAIAGLGATALAAVVVMIALRPG